MAEDENAPRDFQAVLNGTKPERNKPIIQTSKTATKVDMIKEMVERYNQRSIDDLLKAIMRTGDKQELEAFRTLKLGPNFQQIFCQAISEIDISRKLVGHTFVDTLMNEAEPAKDQRLRKRPSCSYVGAGSRTSTRGTFYSNCTAC